MDDIQYTVSGIVEYLDTLESAEILLDRALCNELVANAASHNLLVEDTGIENMNLLQFIAWKQASASSNLRELYAYREKREALETMRSYVEGVPEPEELLRIVDELLASYSDESVNSIDEVSDKESVLMDLTDKHFKLVSAFYNAFKNYFELLPSRVIDTPFGTVYPDSTL